MTYFLAQTQFPASAALFHWLSQATTAIDFLSSVFLSSAFISFSSELLSCWDILTRQVHRCRHHLSDRWPRLSPTLARIHDTPLPPIHCIPDQYEHWPQWGAGCCQAANHKPWLIIRSKEQMHQVWVWMVLLFFSPPCGAVVNFYGDTGWRWW